MKLIEKAKIELYTDAYVERKIYEYEGKAIFKHNGSWHYCRQENGQWVKYQIRISQYKVEVPKPEMGGKK